MCLISQRSEPFTAQKDLRVFKLLKSTHDDCDWETFLDDDNVFAKNKIYYQTPYMYTKITVPTTMKGEKYGEVLKSNNKTQVTSGYIHSMLSCRELAASLSFVVAQAYIPKGTKYYIGAHRDICSEILNVTDKLYYYAAWSDLQVTDSELADIYAPVNDMISEDHICAGWLMDNSFNIIHPNDKQDKEIIGIVGGFDNNGYILVLNINPLYKTGNELRRKKDDFWYMGDVADHKNTIGANFDIIDMSLKRLNNSSIPEILWTSDKIKNNDWKVIYYSKYDETALLNPRHQWQTMPFLKAKIDNGKIKIMNNISKTYVR